MKPKKTITLSERHQIEIGESTWNNSQLSIRNRYKLANGRIDPRSSSEIPRNDLPRLFVEAIKFGLFERNEQIEMLEELVKVIKNSYIPLLNT